MAEIKDPAELVGLQTLGVSLVKRGANRKWIAMTKAEGMTGTIAALKQLIEKGVLPDDAAVAKACLDAGLDEKETEAVKAMLRIRGSFPTAENIDKALHTMLGGNAMQEPKTDPAVPPAENKGDNVADEQVNKELIEKAEATNKRLGELEALLKSQTDLVSKAEAKAKEQEVLLKAEQTKRRESEWLVKAESLKGIPGKSIIELAKSLMDLEDKAGAEFAATHYETLKASSAALLKSALFVDTPVVAGQDGVGAWAKIEKLANEFVSKAADTAEEKYMTGAMKAHVKKARAVAEVCKANPELYAELNKEKSTR